MKKFLLVLFSLLFVSVVANAQKTEATCGEERWPVKTLADAKAQQAAGHDPVKTTVSNLVSIKAPTRAELDASPDKRFPEELKTYSVHVLVVGYKKEADSDFHIAIADPEHPKVTMIAEIPASHCVNDTFSTEFGKLQAQFVQDFSNPGKYKTLKVPVKAVFTGVGFFDFIHGQTGVSKNGFELHPLLAFKKE